MSGEQNPTLTLPAHEYAATREAARDAHRRAEDTERAYRDLRARVDADAIAAAVRTAATQAGVRGDALDDAVALLAPALRVEGDVVRVKGQPEVDLAAHLGSFFEARPHWRDTPGRPATAPVVAPASPPSAPVQLGSGCTFEVDVFGRTVLRPTAAATPTHRLAELNTALSGLLTGRQK